MLKKILATLLIVSLTTVYANQINAEKKALQNELAQSFNELNYKLNVEWDQKDSTVFNQTMDGFQSQIADLQAKGLSNDDLVAFTMSKIKDESAKAEVSKLASVIAAKNMSSDEARAFAVRNLNNTYSHGASWSGGRVALKVAALVAAVVIIVLLVSNKKDDKKETTTPTPTKTPTESPSPTYSPSPSPTYSPSPSPTYYNPCSEATFNAVQCENW